MSKYKQMLAKQLAMKAMSMGGNVEGDDEDDYETPMGLQERGEYHPEEMGGSEELARSLMQQMAEGGMVLAMHSPDVEPDEPATVPTRTPESLMGSSDLTEEARIAIMDKKKRRRFSSMRG